MGSKRRCVVASRVADLACTAHGCNNRGSSEAPVACLTQGRRAMRRIDISEFCAIVQALGRITQDKSRAKIESFTRTRGSDLEAARRALSVIAKVGVFFEPKNLGRLAAWAKAHIHHSGRLQAVGGELIMHDASKEPATVRLFPGWRPPGEAFAELYEASTDRPKRGLLDEPH